MKPGKVLVVDDEKDIRELVEEILAEEGLTVSTAANGEQARQQWRQSLPDVIFLDVWMPDIDGISLLKELKQDSTLEHCQVVMMSGHGTIETAIAATKLGAYDFLEKPLSLGKLLLTAERALEHGHLNQENRQLKKHVNEHYLPIGKSKLISQLRETVERLGDKFSMPILIEGEPGSGKHHLGRALHRRSQRGELTLIEISALDLNHLQQEQNYDGLIKLLRDADQGTMVIKDIELLNEPMQKLFNDLIQQQVCFIRNESYQFDIRLIALNRGNLAQSVASGRFREDLFERLKVMTMHTPALRQHTEDIPELVEFFVDMFVTQDGLNYRSFTVAAQNVMRQYHWPGNLKELKNLIQRLLIMGDNEVSDEEVRKHLSQASNDQNDLSHVDTSLTLKEAKERFEACYLSQLLRETSGNVSETAKRSGVDRTNLYRKLKNLDIDPKNPV